MLGLADAAAAADGVGPLSEQVRLHLAYSDGGATRDLLLWHGAALAGYAHLDPTDPVEGPSGELVVHPGYRGRGLGLALIRALLAETGPRPLRAGARDDSPRR